MLSRKGWKAYTDELQKQIDRFLEPKGPAEAEETWEKRAMAECSKDVPNKVEIEWPSE